MLFSQRLLTPGPTPIPDRVRLAMAQPMIHHRKPEFKAIMAQTQEYLKELFGTKEPVLTLSCSGSGAMTAAVTNLFSPGEKVLVAQAGKFGERWTNIAKSHACEVVEIQKPWGQPILAEDIETVLQKDSNIKGVLIQISETSTGVMHPIQEIAACTNKYNVLLVADGISSVGISPTPMDKWGIDVLLTGSQKGLMVPPGLALIALSQKAWAKAETQKNYCFYFNLCAERDSILKNQTNFTSPVSLIIGLKEALAMLFESGGLETLYRKQWALTQMTRTGVEAMGLKLFAQNHYTWGVTSIEMPEGVNASELVANATANCGVTMAAGQAPMKDTMLRLGHMGWVDWADIMAGLHALEYNLPKQIPTNNQAQNRENYLELAINAWHSAINSNTYGI